MPLTSAALLARIFTALQNMYKSDGAETETVEGAGQIKKPNSQGQIRSASSEGRIGGGRTPAPAAVDSGQETAAQRAERNRLQRERNRRRREEKHGRG